MPESWKSRLERWGFNLFPAVLATGMRITYIASDHREVRIRLPLSWRTRNYVGTIFGGSIYAATDPIYAVMLMKLLGPNFVVWDKAANIQFKKPGRSTLYANFKLEESELETIRLALETQPSVNRVYTVDLADKTGLVCATVEKTLYVRRKDRNPATVMA